MRKILYLLIILVVMGACSMSKQVPEWVEQRPYNNEYYTAVVRFNKKAPNYVDLARDNALREISTQISVQIDSDIYLKETEANGIPSAELISQIKSSSRNKLKDIQLYGTYENDRDYWAYYRLSKSAYHAWRVQQRDLAISQALKLMEEYDDASTGITAGISSLLKALELVVDFTDLDLTAAYRGNEINLYNELFSRLQSLPETIVINLDPQNINMVAKLRRTASVSLNVKYNKESRIIAASAFPLKYDFDSGAGDIVETGVTDTNGMAMLVINRISSYSPQQSIYVTPDKAYWLQSLENPVIKQMFSILRFSPAKLNISVNKPRAFLIYSFDGKPGSSYKDMVVNKLQNLDMEVLTDIKASDYTFRIEIVSHEGEYVNNLRLYSATADANVELLDTRTGISLFSTTVAGIKSTGNNRENARKASELAAVNRICDNLMFSLVEQHIMR